MDIVKRRLAEGEGAGYFPWKHLDRRYDAPAQVGEG